MGYRQAILSLHGYKVKYETRPKYRCSADTVTLCVALKDSVRYFAFRISAPDYVDHFRRLEKIQFSIPHMARMVGPIGDVVLLEAARGQLLWEMETPPDNALIEKQLIEFARGTKQNRLVHGDLRPWNVFFDDLSGVQVIDWWFLSAFVDDLVGDRPRRRDLISAEACGDPGHYVRFHPDLVAKAKFTEIDVSDAKIIGSLLRGEFDLSDSRSWKGHYSSYGRFLWQY